MAVKTEETPITITLGNLLKIFTDEKTSNNTFQDQALLGKDACTFLYGDITKVSSSINKIRKCPPSSAGSGNKLMIARFRLSMAVN